MVRPESLGLAAVGEDDEDEAALLRPEDAGVVAHPRHRAGLARPERAGGNRRAMRSRLGSLSRYSKIFFDVSASSIWPRATRVIHSATSCGERARAGSPSTGRGPRPSATASGSCPSSRMCEKPSAAIRALIASTPRRRIHALVAVLSDGPIMSVARSFQVGFNPASSSRSSSRSRRPCLVRQLPALGQIHASLAHAGHRLGEHGDLDHRGRFELGLAVVLVAHARLEVPRRDAHAALAAGLGGSHGRVESGRRRARGRARPERHGPRRPRATRAPGRTAAARAAPLHPAYPSTLMPFSMRRTRPGEHVARPDLEAAVHAVAAPAAGWTRPSARASRPGARGRRADARPPRSRARRPRWSRPEGARR